MRGIQRSPVNSPHKGQWRGTLMFSMICTWINAWVNNRKAGDLSRHCALYDVIVMVTILKEIDHDVTIVSSMSPTAVEVRWPRWYNYAMMPWLQRWFRWIVIGLAFRYIYMTNPPTPPPPPPQWRLIKTATLTNVLISNSLCQQKVPDWPWNTVPISLEICKKHETWKSRVLTVISFQ